MSENGNSNNELCTAAKKDGRPCGGKASPGRPFCYFHDPENAAKLAESRRRGGINRRRAREHTETPGKRMRSVEEVLLIVEAATADAFRLEASERRCRVLGYLSGVALKALDTAKLEEIEARLLAIEERQQDGRQRESHGQRRWSA